jgi:hypothetical protein
VRLLWPSFLQTEHFICTGFVDVLICILSFTSFQIFIANSYSYIPIMTS